MGYSADDIQGAVDRLNTVLTATKQKEANLETRLIAMLLIWLSLCFTGGFLMAFYLHFGYAFLFICLYVIGCFLFCAKFKSATDS